MSEVVDTDSQALHHLLTEAGVDWDGLSGEGTTSRRDALLGDEQAALILDESAFAKKGTASAGVAVCGTAGWVRWTILRWVSSRPCAGTNE